MKIKTRISIRQMLCTDTGKVVHFTEDAAKAVARKRKRRYYKCKHCSLWHTAKVRKHA